MNLLAETLQALIAAGKDPLDVRFVQTDVFNKGVYVRSGWKELGTCDWNGFAKWAEENYRDYDSGFGGQEVTGSLVIVGNDWWLERYEYDGSEEWKYKERPLPRMLKAGSSG